MTESSRSQRPIPPVPVCALPTKRPPTSITSGGFEPELSLLKALLHLPGAAGRVADELDPDDFALTWSKVVVAEVKHLHRAGQPVTVDAVHQGLLTSGEHSSDDDRRNLELRDVTVPTDDIEAIAAIVIDRGRRHRLGMRLAAARRWLEVGGDPQVICQALHDQLVAEIAHWTHLS